MAAALVFLQIKFDATKGYMWYIKRSLPHCNFFRCNAATSLVFQGDKSPLGGFSQPGRWHPGSAALPLGPSGGSQTLLVAQEEVLDSPCVSSWTGFYLPCYLYFTLWYHLCVPLSKYWGLCTRGWPSCERLSGSSEERIVLLLKYNLWNRNDHRCKFILHTFFFHNKNMYIFIWGESSIKMRAPGECCHTRAQRRAHACMHKEPQGAVC